MFLIFFMFRKYNELPVSNTEFPFRKYKTDFIPYAPYKGLHDSGIVFIIFSLT